MKKYILLFCLGCFFSCSDEESDLVSVEERVDEAVDDLRDELRDPRSGWKAEYQPVEGAGTYLLILDFGENDVRIQSDVGVNEGEFFDHTIPYRVDAVLDLELVFETYGVFHYLFELEQSTFGGEFEFIYSEKDGDNLVFTSKTDGFNPTTLTLVPAQPSDPSLLAREVSSNLSLYENANRSRLFGGEDPIMQAYFPSENLSVFFSIDFARRILTFDLAGIGKDISSILSSENIDESREFNFGFEREEVVLDEALTFDFNGGSYSIQRLSFRDMNETGGAPFCNDVETPLYSGNVPNIGDFILTQTLFKSSGDEVIEQEDRFYSVNIPFVFDGDLNQLSVDGSINERLPSAEAFMMTYGFVNDSIPANSIGFLVEDENEATQYYLRELQINKIGNEFSVTLEDSYYFSGSISDTDSVAVKEILEEVLSEGQFLAYRQEGVDFDLFRFYNPCNRYEWLFVQ